MNKWLVEVIDAKGHIFSHDFVYAKTLEEARRLGQKFVVSESVAAKESKEKEKRIRVHLVRSY